MQTVECAAPLIHNDFCLSPVLTSFWKLFSVSVIAWGTYLYWSHFRVICQHEPIMKLKVSSRPGFWQGRQCTLESKRSRITHQIPNLQMCLMSSVFCCLGTEMLQSGALVHSKTICWYLSQSKSLQHYWSQKIQVPDSSILLRLVHFPSCYSSESHIQTCIQIHIQMYWFLFSKAWT